MSVDRKGMLTSRCSFFLWGFLGLCPTMAFHEISAVELYRMVSSAPHAASNLELNQPEMFGKELYTPALREEIWGDPAAKNSGPGVQLIGVGWQSYF